METISFDDETWEEIPSLPCLIILNLEALTFRVVNHCYGYYGHASDTGLKRSEGKISIAAKLINVNSYTIIIDNQRVH